MKKILLSYYTEGSPFDEGVNLTKQKEVFLEIGRKYFDEVITFCPRELIKLNSNWKNIVYDESYFKKHLKASKKYKINMGWAQINGFLYKPNIINMVLNNDIVKEGDLIVYHDIDLFKYENYIQSIKTFSRLIEKKLRNKSILIGEGLGKLPHSIKHEILIKHFGISGRYHSDFSGSAIAFKKDVNSIVFCKHWLELTSIEFYRSQITNFPNKKEFIWHTPDQSCLTLVVYDWLKSKKRKRLTRFFLFNRKHLSDCGFIEVLKYLKLKLSLFSKINPIVFFKERYLVKTF